MSAAIGLYPCNQEVDHQIHKLEEAGYSKDRISVISQARSIYQLMDCYPAPVVSRYAGWGVFFGILIYGIFALVASWCECNIFQYSHEIAFGTVLVGVLFGGSIGAFIGCITGMAEYENQTHLYTQGIQMGNKVLLLRVNTEESELAKKALRNIGCTGIKALDKPENN
jgi:hypothetical protein